MIRRKRCGHVIGFRPSRNGPRLLCVRAGGDGVGRQHVTGVHVCHGPSAPGSAALRSRRWVAGRRRALRVVTLCLVNRERAGRGLPHLVVQPELQRAAQRQSEDMGARRFFAHVNPDGLTPTDRIRAAGYPARSWTGENLYAGYDADADADADATAAAVRGCTAPATRTTSCARSSRGRHRHRRPAGRVGCARASGRVHEHFGGPATSSQR